MVRIDNAEAVRRLAYEVWEREGRPSGREHEHWAEANRIMAARYPETVTETASEPRWNRIEAERAEAEALRRALWTPEPFSTELFGQRSPAPKPRNWSRRTSATPLPTAQGMANSGSAQG
ncbi:DUF2934 domain-containing protein [Aurantimonas sp. A2-1-M11]|uniref:DUF2934 domain-containing protein n=1 Tax=Aurantimonas sp. A2-1-M11 TaxID=3113712 RepID=UPI002F9475AF